MADNTRVNDLQNKFLKAIDILNAQALNSISFDKTITCKIENDKDKKDGRYEVNDGNRIFTAYSSDTRLRSGDTVYVTVPEGNFENQKMIIGKKTAENDKPFNFTQPFDTFFDMTGNIITPDEIKKENKELIANSIEDKDALIENCKTSAWLIGSKDTNGDIVMTDVSNKDLIKYARLAVRADFRTWIKNAVRGEYGINIYLRTSKPKTVSAENSAAENNEQIIEYGDYKYNWNNSMMYGNTYNFETYYSQEIVLDLEKQDIGRVDGIAIEFYQKANFYDKFNEPIPSSEEGFETKTISNEYERYLDGNGYYIKQGNDLSPNIFIDNFYLGFGYDISTFTDDYVEIYTQNRNSYRRSTEVGNDYTKENQKEIKMRWVHLKDGNPVDMVAAAGKQSSETGSNYEVRWYRYSVGGAAADEYCGIYWIEENGNGFNLTFNPDVNKQQEKIKAIVLCDGIPYRSNELIFENEEDLPPSQEAQHIASALNIVCDDGTKGNYFLYGQAGKIKDQSHSNKDRILKCYFDADNNGEHKSLIQDPNAITWVFPNKNTMIELVGKTEDEKELETIVRKVAQPTYRIAQNYNPKYSNNTIQCIYELNGVIYTTEIDLSFGKVGTMGSDQTLVIDFVGDTIAYTENDKTVQFEIQLLDTSGTPQQIPSGGVKWEWYYNEDVENKVIANAGNSILEISNPNFNIEKLYILQASIGSLITYFAIPIKNNAYSYIDGPTEVIYRSDGKPDYSDLPYKLYSPSGETKGTNVIWSIIPSNGAWGYKYVGTLTESQFADNSKIYCTRTENYITEDGEKKFVDYTYTEQLKSNYDSTAIYYEKIIDNFIGRINDQNRLEPVSIYIKDAPVYGIKVEVDGSTVWSQPIFVCQNQYPSTVINQWDGKSLVLDEQNSAVIAAAVSAGRKNSDNTFSGVMMGDWSNSDLDTDEEISKQTGLYGFHHGAMSYAFKEDGTAFIGKSSMARINFDGNNATITSAGYEANQGGMKINLWNNGNPYISLKSPGSSNTNTIYSEMKLDTKAGGSTIYMKKANGQDITITNTSDTTPLKIGNNFDVDWNGNINAQGGLIGDWKIVNRKLQSLSGNIVLDATDAGSIILKKGTSKISGGILSSSTSDGRIQLDGYLEVGDGYLGEMESGLPGYEGSNGIGMSAGTNKGIVKATVSNAGLSFGGNAYVTVNQNNSSIGNNTKVEINCAGTGNNDNTGIWINGNSNKTTHLHVYNIPAQNQHGIYARFA